MSSVPKDYYNNSHNDDSCNNNNDIAVIFFGDGRLNPLGRQTRQSLHDQLTGALKNPNILGVVLCGAGPSHFSAGADLTEFDDIIISTNNNSNNTPSLVELVNQMEASDKPVVAALRGVALGGGLELALACHYRVSIITNTKNTHIQLGLPEVTVGVLPGAGGTQRLPRLIGVKRALQMILTGKPVMDAAEALKMGLVDDVVVVDVKRDDDKLSLSLLLDKAKQWARWAALMPLDDRRLMRREVRETPEEVQALCDEALKTLPPRDRGGASVHCALEAIRGCVTQDGMQHEGELFFEALVQGRGRRHAFFAVRAAQKSKLPVPKQHVLLLTSKQQEPKNTHVGVVGAGTMGSGIAMVLLQAGFVVHLVDVNPKALDKGVSFLQQTIENLVRKKKKLTTAQAKFLLDNLKPSSSLQDLHECQLVVEAAVENMQVKRQIFQTLDRVVTSPTALLLSNTSTLDIDQMAAALSPPRRPYCAGWHFFSPAHVMKLVEIVVARDTSDETVAVLQSLTKQRMGKIGVTVGNCHGFVGNRMLFPYTSECVLLLAEGDATVQSIDAALVDFGMALGPLAMSDLAGTDIGYLIRKEMGYVKDPVTGRAPNRKPGMRYTDLGDDLVVELGRVGQKVLKGFYDYDIKVGKGRKPLPSKEVSEFIQRYVTDKNKRQLTPQGIVERVLFPLVNEGFKILEEGIAEKPSDIDVIYLYGYGWPAWRGGPMFWADDEVGLPHLWKRLNEFHRTYPGSDYYVPSRLLERCVQMGVTVEEYYKQGLHKKVASATTSRL